MSTLEDFESAPVGATATGPNGERAIKTHSYSFPWNTARHTGVNDFASLRLFHDCYVLDPAPPSTAREALDLAWYLAHPVKKGQVIPAGTRVIDREGSGIVVECPAIHRTVDGRPLWMDIRTLDPLPEPTPDWLDAPAVLAKINRSSSLYPPNEFLVWAPCKKGDHAEEGSWAVPGIEACVEWQDLTDVTPLYTKEDA